MWHRDDSIFMEARINLSVTSPEDAFGMEGHAPLRFGPTSRREFVLYFAGDPALW